MKDENEKQPKLIGLNMRKVTLGSIQGMVWESSLRTSTKNSICFAGAHLENFSPKLTLLSHSKSPKTFCCFFESVIPGKIKK